MNSPPNIRQRCWTSLKHTLRSHGPVSTCSESSISRTRSFRIRPAFFPQKADRDHPRNVNRHSTVTHYQRPTVTQLQEGGTGGEVSEILFFSTKSKRRPSLIYSMQIIPVCLSIVARRKGVSATRRGGLNWTPISLLVGHPCKLFHTPKIGRREIDDIYAASIGYRKSYGRIGTFASLGLKIGPASALDGLDPGPSAARQRLPAFQ